MTYPRRGVPSRRGIMPDEIKDAIEENAKGPKAATGDSGSMTQHDVSQQIAAAKFVAAERVKADPFAAVKRMNYGSHE